MAMFDQVTVQPDNFVSAGFQTGRVNLGLIDRGVNVVGTSTG